MQTLEAIHTRRSVRDYTDEPVSEEIVRELIRAAMAAPSAGNEQPWKFIVITDKKLLNAIPSFHPYSTMVLKAQVAVLVCGDLTQEKFKGFWVQDCSACTQNLLLAAHDKGLGAVWTGIYPEQDRVDGMRQLLGLPEHLVPLALIPLGWPAKESPVKNRFDPEKIHYNTWE